MKDTNGFPIYNFNYEQFENKDFKIPKDPRILTYGVSTYLEDWFPNRSLGFRMDARMSRVTSEEFVTMLEYYNKTDQTLPTDRLNTWIKGLGGHVVPNKSYIVNNSCCDNIDTNACGLLAFFGEEFDVCSCKLREFLKKSMTEKDRRYLGSNWRYGTSPGETISEDQLGIMARYLGIKLFIIQNSGKNRYSVVQMGMQKSDNVKIIYSDGNHFEAILFNN